MRKPVASSSKFALSKKSRALLAAALVALGSAVGPLRAQSVDLATIRVRADQGDAEALNVLGNLFANGQGGVARDLTEAMRLYQRSADKGYAPALFNLGI